MPKRKRPTSAVPAYEKRIISLEAQLRDEKTAHAVTRNRLQAELGRVWAMVPGQYISLMGVYPSLRQLLHVLAEAADLQDPSRGAPIEDTMRTEYAPDGETLTPTERAVLTHQKHRATVVQMQEELEWFTHKLSKMIPGQVAEYNPPDGACLECDKPLFQTVTGRRRSYCSTKCRQKAATKRNETSANGIAR